MAHGLDRDSHIASSSSNCQCLLLDVLKSISSSPLRAPPPPAPPTKRPYRKGGARRRRQPASEWQAYLRGKSLTFFEKKIKTLILPYRVLPESWILPGLSWVFWGPFLRHFVEEPHLRHFQQCAEHQLLSPQISGYRQRHLHDRKK